MSSQRLLILFSLGLLLVPVSVEAARRSFVALPFSGPGGATARNGVAQALARKHKQIKPALFSAAAAKLGVKGELPEGMTAVCSKIRCDAVLTGDVRKKGRRFTLTVTVHDGGTGTALGTRQATVRGQRRLGAAGGAVAAALAAYVEQTKFQRKPAPAARPQPQPEPVAQAPAPAPQPPPADPVPEYKPEGEQPIKSRRRRGDDDGEGGEEDEEGVSKRSAPRSYAGLFEVSVALGISSRSAEVAIVDGTGEPSKYEGGAYPEFTLRAGFYPLVLATKSFFRNIGLGASYSRHLTISTGSPDGTAVDTTSQELLLDLRLRWAIFKKPTSPEVTFFAGYGMRDFTLGTNPVMPSITPRFLRFGFDGVVPFGTPYLGFFAGFDARVVLSMGSADEGTALYHLGTRSGGFGISARAGLQGRLGFGLTYFAGFEFLRFSMGFDGIGKKEEDRDRAEPTDVVDQYIRGWAGVGFAY